MNKSFVKLILKFLLLVLILWIIFAIVIHNFKMYIFDGEYASYLETMDYIKNSDEYNDVLISGDSVGKSSIIPSHISDRTYNISMPGTSAIEQYYIIEEYLKNHEKPKTIIMMYSMSGYDQNTLDNFFWKRFVYFNCLSNEQFAEIMKTGLFPNPVMSTFKYLQYKTYMPNQYYGPLKNSIKQRRYETNVDRLNYNREQNGHQYFGLANSYKPNNASIDDMEGFKPLEIIEHYLLKCINLCKENDIKLILLTHPVNFSTYTNTHDQFRIEYTDYMKNLEEDNEGIIVDPNIIVEADSWFGDYVHLNPHGATQFTTRVKERYAEFLYMDEAK